MSKLQDILAKKTSKSQPDNSAIVADIIDSVKAEYAHRGGSGENIEKDLAVKVQLGKAAEGRGVHTPYKLEIICNAGALSAIHKEFTNSLDAIRTCGSFKAGNSLRDRGRHKTYTASSLEDIVNALNKVISNPDLRINTEQKGESRA